MLTDLGSNANKKEGISVVVKTSHEIEQSLLPSQETFGVHRNILRKAGTAIFH